MVRCSIERGIVSKPSELRRGWSFELRRIGRRALVVARSVGVGHSDPRQVDGREEGLRESIPQECIRFQV